MARSSRWLLFLLADVLKCHGIEPSPERSRRTTWSTFLKAHWKVLAASEFLTAEVWTTGGPVTHYLLFVISLADRFVHVVGITTRPNEAWMLQVGRNLIDAESGAMRGKGYLILDRDTKYTDRFRRLMRGSGTDVIRPPPRSSNLNAYAERFVRSIKSECLNQMIFIGQASLRRAVAEYVDHYHGERNHQGLDNRLIRGAPSSAQGVGESTGSRDSVGCAISIAATQSVWRRLDNWTIRHAIVDRAIASPSSPGGHE